MFSGSSTHEGHTSSFPHSDSHMYVQDGIYCTRKTYRRSSKGFLGTSKAPKHLFLPDEQFLYWEWSVKLLRKSSRKPPTPAVEKGLQSSVAL